jgi:hypothetical protein
MARAGEGCVGGEILRGMVWGVECDSAAAGAVGFAGSAGTVSHIGVLQSLSQLGFGGAISAIIQFRWLSAASISWWYFEGRLLRRRNSSLGVGNAMPTNICEAQALGAHTSIRFYSATPAHWRALSIHLANLAAARMNGFCDLIGIQWSAAPALARYCGIQTEDCSSGMT